MYSRSTGEVNSNRVTSSLLRKWTRLPTHAYEVGALTFEVTDNFGSNVVLPCGAYGPRRENRSREEPGRRRQDDVTKEEEGTPGAGQHQTDSSGNPGERTDQQKVAGWRYKGGNTWSRTALDRQQWQPRRENRSREGPPRQTAAGWRDEEGGNHLEQDSTRQATMEDTGGGLHPVVDGQSLSEVKWSEMWSEVWREGKCEGKWSEVKCEGKWREVKCEVNCEVKCEVKCEVWIEVKWNEVKWSDVRWSEVKWGEVWSEV